MRAPESAKATSGAVMFGEKDFWSAGLGRWSASPSRPGLAVRRPSMRLPAPVALASIVAAGTTAAIGIGLLAAEDPIAQPADVAIALRMAIIVALTLAGACVLAAGWSRRMGHLLVFAAAYSCVWLLNGSTRPLLFGAGVIATGVAPVVFAYLMLAHPTGRLRSRGEAVFLLGTGTVGVVAWSAAVLTTATRPVATPLLLCPHQCPRNVFYLASGPTGALRPLIVTAWIVLTVGTFVLMLRRLVRASMPVRRSIAPVAATAGTIAALLVVFLLARVTGSRATGGVGDAYVGAAVAVPLAIVAGLILERLYMGRALVEFVKLISQEGVSDVQALMARTLHDPSLRIVYRRPTLGTLVDASGSSAELPARGRNRACTEITRNGRTIASVLYSPELSDQERFIHAAGDAAIATLQREQLEAELAASTSDLAASRRRLVDVADAERRRIQRDLHDGAQQHLLAMRMKLDRAVEAMHTEPRRGETILVEIGHDMEDALSDIRSLAAGVYPPLLAAYGLEQALRSVALRVSIDVSLTARGLGRYSPEVEAAVYFCCLEALQNVVKHGGEGASVALALAQEDGALQVLVADAGTGFDPGARSRSGGLVNMRDRIEAVGGRLEISSAVGAGTRVWGSVPACPR